MQTLAGLQEQETFKALDPSQQQQLSLQMMQSNPLVLQHMQQLQQLQALQQHSQQQQTSQGQSQPTSAAAATLQQQTQPPQYVLDIVGSVSFNGIPGKKVSFMVFWDESYYWESGISVLYDSLIS